MFRFANYYGDHMVLQRAPERANIWGYVGDCKAVAVTFNSTKIPATLTPGNSNMECCRLQSLALPLSDQTMVLCVCGG